LFLETSADARPAPREAAGLFHAALLFPDRASLGVWLRRAAERRITFQGFSDHGVSEALYFADPDGNGLEFYVDRPRAAWPLDTNGGIAMSTEPLDIDSLLAAGANLATAVPLAGAHWGHLHLRVTDLDRSEAFYCENLGLEVTQRSYPGARFLAADGYHHHLGLNVWSHSRVAQPAHALGLAEAGFILHSETSPRTLIDPNGLAVRITPA
jgi:catechol 2,3-dioxygenase